MWVHKSITTKVLDAHTAADECPAFQKKIDVCLEERPA